MNRSVEGNVSHDETRVEMNWVSALDTSVDDFQNKLIS